MLPSYGLSTCSRASRSISGSLYSNSRRPGRPMSSVSVYGGAGGRCVRSGCFRPCTPARVCIAPPYSASSNTCGVVSISSVGVTSSVLLRDEKEAMQSLNDRLASYLDRVRSLEAANRELELKIQESRKQIGPQETDWDYYLSTIKDLFIKIEEATVQNSRISLEMDHCKLAAEDFHLKLETEAKMRQSLEADISRLLQLNNEYFMTCESIRGEIEMLTEEQASLKKNHREEMDALRKQNLENDPSLNVEVQQSPTVDLAAMIAEVRRQYETMIQMNRDEAEASFRSKLDQASSSSDESNALMERTKEEYSKVRQQFQGAQVELETLRNVNIALEETLKDFGEQFDCDVKGLQASIDRLEAELHDVRSSINQQLCEHEALLNAKMKLEMEIATYRRLIEAEEGMNISSLFTASATDLPSNTTSSYISSISTDTSSSTIKSGSRFSYSGSSGGHSNLPTNLTANTSVTSGGGSALVFLTVVPGSPVVETPLGFLRPNLLTLDEVEHYIKE
uniref:keratin, type I cytoskeletal 19-like n=1 Tax=Myxine glutinosa TaxID=7769 RepID=UPI00358ED580